MYSLCVTYYKIANSNYLGKIVECFELQLKVLSSGLLENMTITQLDLSQNKISDRGARALAKVRGADNGFFLSSDLWQTVSVFSSCCL